MNKCEKGVGEGEDGDVATASAASDVAKRRRRRGSGRRPAAAQPAPERDVVMEVADLQIFILFRPHVIEIHIFFLFSMSCWRDFKPQQLLLVGGFKIQLFVKT